MKEPSLSEIEGGTPDSGIAMDDGKYAIVLSFYFVTFMSNCHCNALTNMYIPILTRNIVCYTV